MENVKEKIQADGNSRILWAIFADLLDKGCMSRNVANRRASFFNKSAYCLDLHGL